MTQLTAEVNPFQPLAATSALGMPALLEADIVPIALQAVFRLYDASGVRQPLPDNRVLACDFELLQRGGYGTFSLSLLAEYDDDSIPALPGVNWRFEVWFAGVPAYRGWIESAAPAIQEGPPIAQYQGSGLVGRCKTLKSNCRYAVAGGADISSVYAWFWQRFLRGSERLGTLPSAISPLSPQVLIETYDAFNQNLLQTLEGLADASGDLGIYGFDMTDPASAKPEGVSRFYFKPRPTSVTNEDYRFRIGKDVQYFDDPKDLSQVVNAAWFAGGAAKQPNLAYNPSFELPVIAGTNGAGNVIPEPSFENSGTWTYGSDASRRKTGSDTGEYARTGDYFAEVDNPGEYIEQTFSISGLGLTADTLYTLIVPMAAEAPASDVSTRSAKVTLECQDSSHGVLSTPINAESVTVAGQSYVYYPGGAGEWDNITVPATTKYIRLRIAFDASDGANNTARAIMIDDVQLYDVSDLAQDGWQVQNRGSAVAAMIWAMMETISETDNAPFHGIYNVRAVVAGADGGDTNSVWIKPTDDHWIACRPSTGYQFTVRERTSGAYAVRLGLEVRHTNNKIDQVWSTATTTAGTTAWASLQSGVFTVASDAQAIRPIIELRGAHTYDFDAVDFVEVGLDDRTDFIDGANVRLYFRADDDTSLPDLSTDAQNSITDYGLRESAQDVDVSNITDIASIKAYATGFFNRYAIPLQQGRLTLSPARVHVKYLEDDDAGTPSGMIAISGAKVAINDSYPAKIHYTLIEGGYWKCDIDLGNVRPDPALVLRTALGIAVAGSPSASSGGGANFSPSPGNSVAGGGADGAYTETDPLSLHLDGDNSMTGTLNSRAVIPTADNTYDHGDATHRIANAHIVQLVSSLLQLAEGSDACMGVETLSSGAATVSTNKVAADSRIFLCAQSDSANAGALWVSGRTDGTSFDIKSDNALDDRDVAWIIVKPG